MSNNIEGIAEDVIDTLNAWLTKAGLRGEPEAALVSGFCERAVAAGLPVSRAQVLIDTLHPVYEGRVVRWGHDPSQPLVHEYGRTGWPEGTTDLHPLVRRRADRGGHALARKPVLPHVADRGKLAAAPRHRGERSRVSRDAGLPGGGHDRLHRHHQPLRARRHYRRNGLRLLLVGNHPRRRLRRCPYCSTHARGPNACAGGKGGRARAHDRDVDGDLSRARRRAPRAQRPHHARRRRSHRRRHLVQRPARLHAHHRIPRPSK